MDWNNDGRIDLLSGDPGGHVWLYLNKGSKRRPKLARGVQVEAGGEAIRGYPFEFVKGPDGKTREKYPGKLSGLYSKLHYADWDCDGLNDILVGQDGPRSQPFVWYRNIGKKGKPRFAAPEEIKSPLPMAGRPSPYLADLDQDGSRDILFGTEKGDIYFFANRGTTENPKWGKGMVLKLAGGDFNDRSMKGGRCRLHVVDWNNDGKLDLLVGNLNKQGDGNVWLFLKK